MWPYWMMFLIPVLALLQRGRLKESQAWAPWAGVFLVYVLMIGLRNEVGGDWFNYLAQFYDAGRKSLDQILLEGDPGYYGLNWVVYHLGGNIHWVNLVCATILVAGTITFCRAQPNPWMAMLAAVPYMLIVVGMGYTRQSVALGFALLGLTALGHGRVRLFVFWVAVGALFHKTAVLLMPIAALAASRNRVLTFSLVIATSLLFYYLLLAESSEILWENYVVSQYESEGGGIRVGMNALPALLLLVFRRRLAPGEHEKKLWLWMALLSIACVPFVFTASTAVDRVALYFIPIQIFVFSRITRLTAVPKSRGVVVLFLIAYYAAVLFVWLNFATHSRYWIPYKIAGLDANVW